MNSRFLGSMFLAAAVALAFTGCGLFDNSTPAENTLPVAGAIDDPTGGFISEDLGGQGGFGGAGAWEDGASGNIGGAADADGWVVADPENNLNMPVIYFAYDSDVLVSSQTANLDRIAEYMQGNPVLGLVIQGHCDQRGTEEYNRALGERRANAIRAYLAGKGLEDSRMKTISYGKDNPAVEGSGESVWSQNRRGVPVPMKMPR